MSINDSSTVLSVRGSEVLEQNLDSEVEPTKDVPELYEQSYATLSSLCQFTAKL